MASARAHSRYGSFHLSFDEPKDTAEHRVTSRDVAARALLPPVAARGRGRPWPPVAARGRAARGRPWPPVAARGRGRPSPPVAVAARGRPWPWPPVAARRHFRTICGKRKIDFLMLF